MTHAVVAICVCCKIGYALRLTVVVKKFLSSSISNLPYLKLRRVIKF